MGPSPSIPSSSYTHSARWMRPLGWLPHCAWHPTLWASTGSVITGGPAREDPREACAVVLALGHRQSASASCRMTQVCPLGTLPGALDPLSSLEGVHGSRCGELPVLSWAEGLSERQPPGFSVLKTEAWPAVQLSMPHDVTGFGRRCVTSPCLMGLLCTFLMAGSRDPVWRAGAELAGSRPGASPSHGAELAQRVLVAQLTWPWWETLPRPGGALRRHGPPSAPADAQLGLSGAPVCSFVPASSFHSLAQILGKALLSGAPVLSAVNRSW